MARNTKAALHWIVRILRAHSISFQISGGFAARIYGSKRPLADIDIEVNDAALEKILPKVKRYITYGPRRYKDCEWDLLLLTLKYRGQEIDIYSIDSLMLFDKQKMQWCKERNDLSRAVRKRAYGLVLPIVPLRALIAYKKKIRRPVDLQDIDELTL